MTVLQRFGDLPAVPWRNGGGMTREIYVLPVPESGGAGFLARVSIADVDASGPFSAYPGIDRVIMLLSGEGMRLRVGGSPGAPDDVRLHANEPFAFDGGTPVDCEIASPTRDLNLMTFRGRATGSMTVHRGDTTATAGSDGDTLVVIGLDGGAVAGQTPLAALDSVISDRTLEIAGHAALITIRVQ